MVLDAQGSFIEYIFFFTLIKSPMLIYIVKLEPAL
jgi:hypothetical protein